MKRKFLIVIPARINSSRFYAKPLKKIYGIPMVIRTAMQCNKATKKKNIIIATDSKKIQDACIEYNFQSLMTSKKLLTGTDRVCAVAKKYKADYYINVQGDEPIFNPNDIKLLMKEINKNHKEVLLGYAKINEKKDILNKNIPKICFDKNFKLLYASRLPIPGRDYKKNKNYYRQILAYSFPYKHLIKFSKIKKKQKLEKAEDIEILRFLELGITVKLLKMSQSSYPVDVPNDLKKVKRILKKSVY